MYKSQHVLTLTALQPNQRSSFPGQQL